MLLFIKYLVNIRKKIQVVQKEVTILIIGYILIIEEAVNSVDSAQNNGNMHKFCIFRPY